MWRQMWGKLRRKGLRGSLRVLRERYLYRHWELLMLERDLAEPVRVPSRLAASWPAIILTADQLPVLQRYFAGYLPTVRDLLGREGMTGFAHLDREGQAACMALVSDRDYFDHHLYRCWVRLPVGCIYQFAGEVAVPYRTRGLPLLALARIWEHYRALGYQRTRALVNTNNRPALAMHARLGFRELGESVHTYCLLRCLHFSRNARYSDRRLPAVPQRAAAGAGV